VCEVRLDLMLNRQILQTQVGQECCLEQQHTCYAFERSRG
jgi:hypothetical protein